MKNVLHTHRKALAELNITPLLDLVFVLLVIFIITTPQLLNSFEMALPANQSTPNHEPKPARILVMGHDRVRLDSQEFTKAGLKDALLQRKNQTSALTLTVQAEDDADYQSLIDVIDLIQELGISQMGLLTTPHSHGAL
jgi:biopolymer transport protein ExbD